MEIYLIVIEDRHNDVVVLPRRDKRFAIEEARGIAGFRASQHNYEINTDNPYTTALYFAQYSCEGDCVYVVDAELK